MEDKFLHPIYTRYIDKRSQRKRLSAVLRDCIEFDDFYVQHDEERAKSALVNFFNVYLNEKPDKRLKNGRVSYYSFYLNLLPLRQALIKKQYALACHELLTLCAYEPYMQRRIYSCLEEIYRAYLKA